MVRLNVAKDEKLTDCDQNEFQTSMIRSTKNICCTLQTALWLIKFVILCPRVVENVLQLPVVLAISYFCHNFLPYPLVTSVLIVKCPSNGLRLFLRHYNQLISN